MNRALSVADVDAVVEDVAVASHSIAAKAVVVAEDEASAEAEEDIEKHSDACVILTTTLGAMQSECLLPKKNWPARSKSPFQQCSL